MGLGRYGPASDRPKLSTARLLVTRLRTVSSSFQRHSAAARQGCAVGWQQMIRDCIRRVVKLGTVPFSEGSASPSSVLRRKPPPFPWRNPSAPSSPWGHGHASTTSAPIAALPQRAEIRGTQCEPALLDRLDVNGRPRQESSQIPSVISDVAALTLMGHRPRVSRQRQACRASSPW